MTEQGLTAVELAEAGERRTIVHAVSLPFSAELNLDAPERLGKELRQLLRRQGVQASRCVVGLAASLTASRLKQLPPASEESLRGILGLAAEREFASGAGELVFDYSRGDVDGGTSVLLVAAPRRIVAQVTALAQAAGLSLAGITSTIVALAQETAGEPAAAGGRFVLCLLDRSAELIWQWPGSGGPSGRARSRCCARLLRHVPVRWEQPAEAAQSVAGELRRILLTSAGATLDGESRHLLVWRASAAANGQAVEAISQATGLDAQTCQLADALDRVDAPAALDAAFAPAAALAAIERPLPLDFLHSRLAPPARRRLPRPVVWAAAAVLALLGGALYLWLDWRADSQQVAKLQQQIDQLRQPAQQARAVVDDVAAAAGWYDRRPQYLDCLLEITQAFPQEGRIYATSLVMKEDMQVLLMGKSSSQEAVQDVIDRLTANPRLTNVKTVFTRKASANSPEVSFALNVGLAGAK